MMASMFASGSSWFSLIVGVAILVEVAVVTAVRRRTDSGRRTPHGGQRLMLLSLGVMLISGSVARLGRLTGAEMTCAFLVGMASALLAIVFAIRSLDTRRGTARPSREDAR